MRQWLAKIGGPVPPVQGYTRGNRSGSHSRGDGFPGAAICLLLAIGFGFSTVTAQSASTGIIQGTVVADSTGAPLVAVNVSLAGTPYGTMTNAEGFYLLRNVPAGEHTVVFRYVGYQEVRMTGVRVLPALRTTVDVRMIEAPITMDPVVVTAERPLIQQDVTGTMHRVASIEIERLPVDTYQDILDLQPGVVSGGHIRGGRTGETLYLLDGVPIQDPSTGVAAAGLPKSAITELNIHTGGFDAEYGNALSGVVHIVTRRGTATPQGMVRYDRDDLDGLYEGTEHSRRSQAEIMLGGPLSRDTAYYFLAADRMASGTRWWQDLEHTGLGQPWSEQTNLFGRIDLYASQTLRLALQGLYSHDRHQTYEWRWRFNLDGLPVEWRTSGRAALTLNHMLSPAVFYDLQLSFFRITRGVNEGQRSSVAAGELWHYDDWLQYVAPGGGERLWWYRGNQGILTGRGAVTAQLGRHRLRAGFESSLYRLESDLLKLEPQMTLYGLPLPGETPLDYSHTYTYWPRTGGLFVQDTYESGDGLVVKFGLRWDRLDPRAERPVVEWVPAGGEEFEQQISTWVPAEPKAQLSPRVGLAYPLPGPTWFLFNYGEFFQVPLFDQLYSGLNLDLTRGLRVLIGNPDLKHERTRSYEFALRRQLDENSVGSATYFFKESSNLIDTKTFLAANSRSLEDGFTQYVNLPLARSSGLELTYERRPVRGFGLRASYTFMIARGHADTGESGLRYLEWGFEPSRRMHYLSWDQRHTLTAELMGRIGDIFLDLVGRFNTARPYTYAPSASGVLPEGTDLVPNNERMRDVFSLDARLSREIVLGPGGRMSLLLFCDVRNLTDRRNVLWISSDGRIGGELGDPGAWTIGRRTRIGLEVRW